MPEEEEENNEDEESGNSDDDEDILMNSAHLHKAESSDLHQIHLQENASMTLW